MSSIEAAPVEPCTTCSAPTSIFIQQCCNGKNNVYRFGFMHKLQGERGLFYCDSMCEWRDGLMHADYCSRATMIRSVFNAGLLLQRMFYDFFEKIDITPLVKVQVGKPPAGSEKWQKWLYVTVHDDDHPPKENYNRYGTFGAWPFQNLAFKCQQDRETALAWLNCDNALVLWNETVKYMLLNTGLVDDIWEAVVKVWSKAPVHVQQINEGASDPSAFGHSIWRFTVDVEGRMEDYVMDLSSAQYGFHDHPIVPTKKYIAQRCDRVLPSFDDKHAPPEQSPGIFAKFGSRLKARRRDNPDCPLVLAIPLLQAAIDIWVDEENMCLEGLLALGGTKFEAASDNLWHIFDEVLLEYIEGGGRLN